MIALDLRIVFGDRALVCGVGQLTNHWIEIARETCEQVLSQNNQLVLDVAGVTFADRNGIEFLQTILQQQVELKNCSPFLTEQLKQAA